MGKVMGDDIAVDRVCDTLEARKTLLVKQSSSLDRAAQTRYFAQTVEGQRDAPLIVEFAPMGEAFILQLAGLFEIVVR